MKIKALIGEDGYSTKVVNADTGEILDGVLRIEISVDAGRKTRAILTMTDFEAEYEGSPTVMKACAYCLQEMTK